MESWNSEERYENIKILRETVSSCMGSKIFNQGKINLL